MSGIKSTVVTSWLSTLPSSSEIDSDPSPSLRSAPPSPCLPLAAHKSCKRAADDLTSLLPSPKPPCTTRRLTRRALKEIEGNLALVKTVGTPNGNTSPTKDAKAARANPLTPAPKNVASIGERTPSTAQRKAHDHDKWEKDYLKTAGPTPNVNIVRDALKDAGMLLDDRYAWGRNPELREKIDSILKVERNSTLKDQSHSKLTERMEKYGTSTEDTFMDRVWPFVASETHTVPTNKHDVDGNMKFATVNYHDIDDLAIVSKPQFSKGFVPGKIYGKKGTPVGLTEPIPDRVYGKIESSPIYKKELPLPPTFKKTKQLNTQSDWPFCVLEAKSIEGNMGEGVNQAIRDGAVIVNSRLLMKRYVKGRTYTQPYGADPAIYCFSIVVGPDFARISVHWYEKYREVDEDIDLFHMTTMGQFFLNNKEQQQDLRTGIHNIWDWGLVEYQSKAQALYIDALTKYGRKPNDEEFEEFVKAAETDGSSSVG